MALGQCRRLRPRRKQRLLASSPTRNQSGLRSFKVPVKPFKVQGESPSLSNAEFGTRQEQILLTVAMTFSTVAIQDHVRQSNRLKGCRPARMLQTPHTWGNHLFSVAMAAQLADEQMRVSYTSLGPQSEAAARGQATLTSAVPKSPPTEAVPGFSFLPSLLLPTMGIYREQGLTLKLAQDLAAKARVTHEQMQEHWLDRVLKRTVNLLNEHST